ncbi:LuxR C-terminal-related transcriptional regulator [Paenarthrobacter sp. NPDC090522]|uniref:helix-turn-helix transcriptional regulator n=1 Tax=Paenarthrobacter sp. NPDC090522 TaxID=3364383 RepID=UPI0038309BBE
MQTIPASSPPHQSSERPRIFRAMSSLLGARSEQELWNRYATHSREFVRAPYYGYDLLDPTTGTLIPGDGWGLSKAFLSRWSEAGPSFDPAYLEMLRRGQSVSDTDLMGSRLWRHSAAYRELYSIHDITSVLHAPLVVAGRQVGSLSFGTSAAHGLSPADRVAADGLALLVAAAFAQLRSAAVFGPEPRSRDIGPTKAKGSARPALAARITERELSVATLVADGLRDREIADVLCVSLHTVKQHLKNAYRKSGARSRTELVRLLSSEVPAWETGADTRDYSFEE